MSDTFKLFLEDIPSAFEAALASLEEKASSNESLASRLADLKALTATLRFEISGEGGRDFFYTFADGTLKVSDASDETPVIWISQPFEHYIALQDAGVNTLNFAGQSGGAPKAPNPALLDRVKNLNKVLKLVISGVGSIGDAETLIRLGTEATAADPDMTMTAALDDYKAILAGTLPPPVAFMSGKMRIEGDMSIAMQLASLAMS